MAAAAASDISPPHVPVLLSAILEAVAPVKGVWLDGTFGAGGYTRALLEAGAEKVIGVDLGDIVLQRNGETANLAAGLNLDFSTEVRNMTPDSR